MTNNDYSIFVDPFTKQSLQLKDDVLVNAGGDLYFFKDNIPDLIFPKVLAKEDEDAKFFYEGRARQYDDTIHLTFFTHSENEDQLRDSFIDKLSITSDSKVLEIACGTGRDSVLLALRLSAQGELHMQDIAQDMIGLCYQKLKDAPFKKSFCLGNAGYLPYPDKYFDATYSFGAIGEFSDKKRAIKEMVRVTKTGGKVVFGDEGIPVWHRDTEFYKIQVATNPMFASNVPLQDIPVEARDVNVKWVIGGSFYLVDFVVGDGEPTANFDFAIPGIRGGTYRTRYEGQLEGVSAETKKLAWDHVRKKGNNMHDWLESIIRKSINSNE